VAGWEGGVRALGENPYEMSILGAAQGGSFDEPPSEGSAFSSMDDAAVHLLVPARSENVSLIRHALAGFGEALGMDEEASNNLKTAITEACNNAVIHAYDPGEDGVLDVAADEVQGALEITVRDYGHGFRPRLASGAETASLRLGLPLMAALTSGFSLATNPDGGGTSVRLRIPIHTQEEPETDAGNAALEAEPGFSVLTVGDDDLASVIVSRVIASVAARAEMSVDRLSDALLLSDAISSAGSEHFRGGRTRLAVSESEGVIALRVGPFESGGGDRLLDSLAIPSLEASIAKLADEAVVERDSDDEFLVLRIAGGRTAPQFPS
jgi:serine/threonine-protein kinase RsbW